jgi:Ring hydroxylating alpha subunit (catalytic domain)
MRFYMEAFFDRFPGGISVVGAPHKWLLKANWKLPVENQMGDLGHAPFLHAASVSLGNQSNRNPAEELLKYGITAVPKPGHSAAIEWMPADADPKAVAWGIDSQTEQSFLTEYLLEVQRTVAERLSPRHARIRGLSLGIYPNLSLLWGRSTLRISHPRGPDQVEYWSWWVVPTEAPDDIKEALRGKYNFFFGPGGLLEQEDSLAWRQQIIGSGIEYLNDTPYFYGLGIGEEGPHPELPGTVGRCSNEHFARQFYLRWYQEMQQGERLP